MGSTYLPLGHWAYERLNVLVSRGRLEGLQPLFQPYRRIDVAGALGEALAQGRLRPAEREWAEDILAELGYEAGLLLPDSAQDLRFIVNGAVGLKTMSHQHRDPLRPEGDAELFPTLGISAIGDAPMVAGAFLMRWDNHYLNDPQFPNGQVVERRQCDPIDTCAYRVEEAYFELQLPYVRLFYGRMARNWGLPGSVGLMVGDYVYTYDHVGYRFGNDRVSLSGLFALPNDFRGDTVRYFAVHRLDWRLSDDFTLAMSEATLWGGEDARFDLALVNPVGIWEVSGPRGQAERNTNGELEVWWKPSDRFTAYGGLLVDNTRFGDPGMKSGLTQWGSHFGFQLPDITPTSALRVDLSIMNSLAYRSRLGLYESFTLDGIGLARDHTGIVWLAVQGDWFGQRGLTLSPRLDVLWNGEDDLRDPWPDNAFVDYPGVLVGTVETAVRPAIRGRWHRRGMDLQWDAGLNLIKNRGNVDASWEAVPVGRLEFVYRWSFMK